MKISSKWIISTLTKWYGWSDCHVIGFNVVYLNDIIIQDEYGMIIDWQSISIYRLITAVVLKAWKNAEHSKHRPTFALEKYEDGLTFSKE